MGDMTMKNAADKIWAFHAPEIEDDNPGCTIAVAAKADRSGADLRDANIRDANLRCADLRDAIAVAAKADRSGADLRDANIRDANLSGADLRDDHDSGPTGQAMSDD
jgi:uncharacterized protein YjbI with pentapeptide repeats